MKFLATLSLELLLVATTALAQNAGLSGLIRDSSEAVVPHALVSALNTRTGVRRTVESNLGGYYDLNALQPGKYKVSVQAAGFAISIRDGIDLQVADRARLDFTLTVGTVESTVQVNSSEVSYQDAAVSTVISETEISQVPQYLRSWDDLAGLVAGVQGYRYTEQPGSPSSHKQGQFSVHGGRQIQNNWMLDGVDNNTFSTNTIEDTQLVVRPSLDAIAEFRVITSPYSADYGRSPGAAISVSSKGGTNQLHGSLYEYARNRLFDANTFFANRAGLDRPRNNQNLFGVTAGGPLVRNKAFWLIDYEGTRTRQGILRQTTVPLPNERRGDYSTQGAILYDPAGNSPFPGNRIPLDRLDASALKIQNYFPQPNTAASGLNNYARVVSILDDTDRYNSRIDWHPNETNSLFARYTFTPHHRDVPGYFGGLADGTNTAGWGNRVVDSNGAAMSWTMVLSPRLVNDAHASFNRNYSFITQEPFGRNKPSEFIPGIASDPLSDGGIPLTTIRGYTFIGSPDFLPGLETPTQVQFRDTISWTLRTHALKFGGDWHAMRNVWRDIPATRGAVDFSGQFTCLRGAGSLCEGNTGLAYGDFLLGQVQEASLSNLFVADQRLQQYSAFAQDDWKIAPRLTLNLGLRYDFGSTPWEGRNRMANFNPAWGGSIDYAGAGSLENRSLTKQDRLNFGPRVGVALLLDSKTVLRTGYGIFYALFSQNGSDDQLALNPPQFQNNDTSLPSSATEPVFVLQNGFPSNYLSSASGNLSLRAANRDFKSPNMQQWSVGLGRQLPGGMELEVDFVGSKSTHLRYEFNLNQRVDGARPYTGFGVINWFENYANANYNGLEVTLKRRLRQGLTLHAAYTYAKSIDDAGGENLTSNNSGGQQNSRDRAANRAPSDMDIRQRFTTAFVYQLPFGRLQLSGSMIFSSGRPFTVFASSNNGAIDGNSYADLTGRPVLPRAVDCWFYRSTNAFCPAISPSTADAFADPRPRKYGNAGRNVLRGPGFASVDLAVQREFALSENWRLLGRWEVFNVANRAQFGNPNSDIDSGAAGSITRLTGDPRVMQFSLRLKF